MFTGLVEEIGRIAAVNATTSGFELGIEGDVVLADLKIGDSVSVEGVCLTATRIEAPVFYVDLAPETRKRTNLDTLSPGAAVNLERAALPTTRLGGHYVQGHVDGVGVLSRIWSDQDALMIEISAAPELCRYIVEKGYVSLDGASLTIVRAGERDFQITLVPHTQNHITLPRKRVGDGVNIEVDILAKYVERFVAPNSATGVTRDFLSENGFS